MGVSIILRTKCIILDNSPQVLLIMTLHIYKVRRPDHYGYHSLCMKSKWLH